MKLNKRRVGLMCLTAALVCALSVQAGCSYSQQEWDWDQIILSDHFSDNSTLDKVVAEEVSFEVKEDGGQLSVTVMAPDICDDLMLWIETCPDNEFSEAALEDEALRLLRTTKKEETAHILSYSLVDETVEIAYTAEFVDAVNCGLNRFYAEVTQLALEEMETSE